MCVCVCVCEWVCALERLYICMYDTIKIKNALNLMKKYFVWNSFYIVSYTYYASEEFSSLVNTYRITHTHTHTHTDTHIVILIRVLANAPGDRGSTPGRVIPKTQKWYLILPCLILSIIRYRSRRSGAIQGNELRPNLQVGVVTIEKEAFWSPSTTVGQLTYSTYIWK